MGWGDRKWQERYPEVPGGGSPALCAFRCRSRGDGAVTYPARLGSAQLSSAQHGGRGLAGAAGLRPHRALAAAHVRQGAGAAKHIMKIDGRAGLFKGLTPRLCSGAIGTIVHSQVLQRYQEADQEEEPGASLKEPVSSLEQVIKETSREMVARSAATLVTHPFHVITLRCMVQFIGRETKYSGIFSPFVTIYREEGILGFFAGLVPRLLGDVLSLWLCNMLAYLINTYALENGVSTMSEMKSYSQAVTGFFASMLTYPFVLVSNLMAINNCG
uniref:Mitochondrial carrier 2 n=1 Tax=Chrysemys picta bellii TaxID=8478 RepID=A0A8C3HVG4_CHRPI